MLPRVSVETPAPPALLKGALERKRGCRDILPACPFQHLAISTWHLASSSDVRTGEMLTAKC